MKKPSVSFLICTYNAPELISRCINSILKQDYNGKIEIIIIDGGSEKETLDVIERYIKKYSYVKYFHNKNKLPEGYGMGKWLGWKKCSGNFVFILDQDNELQGKNCLAEMLNPFEKEDIFGSACRLFVKPYDSIINRYVALVGTDPFFAYMSLDGIVNLKKIGEHKEDYTLIKLDKNESIITGGNCFIYKKSVLDKVGGYIQDTENIWKIVNSGHDKIAVSDKAKTHHLATKGLVDFIKKKKKWAKSYEQNKYQRYNFSYFPKNKQQRKEFINNLFFIFVFFPNLIIGIKKFIETREKAWLLHSFLTFVTAFIYIIYNLKKIKITEVF